jgi:hypothetical protein
MRKQIIETLDYILAVSDEKIKEGDWIFCKEDNEIYKCYGRMCGLILTQENSPLGVNPYFCVKIIAYKPKGNAPALELPLLPELVVEDEVEKLPYEQLCYYDARNSNNVLSPLQEGELIENSYQEEGIDFAAKGCMCDNCFYGRTKLATQIIKAATKVYSEEDMKEAFNAGTHWKEKWKTVTDDNINIPDVNKFIQSLKQPKPKWFVAEMEQYPINYHKDLWHNKLKTTTINNKKYLVGTYLYE